MIIHSQTIFQTLEENKAPTAIYSQIIFSKKLPNGHAQWSFKENQIMKSNPTQRNISINERLLKQKIHFLTFQRLRNVNPPAYSLNNK